MLGPEVIFIDTSILCTIVPVPGLNQNEQQVRAEMKERVEEGHKFILPITTVIETGNHIAQIDDGGKRRKSAERFADILDRVVAGKTPWTLIDVAWSESFLRQLLQGADTQQSLVDHATSKHLDA